MLNEKIRMSEDERIIHKAQSIAEHLQGALASSMICGEVIKKVDFKGSDLILTFKSGKQLLISAIISDNTLKPHLDFLLSGRDA